MAPASIFYRVLKAGDQLIHRQKSKPVRQQQKPQAFIATRPNQIYSCDITYLPTLKRGISKPRKTKGNDGKTKIGIKSI